MSLLHKNKELNLKAAYFKLRDSLISYLKEHIVQKGSGVSCIPIKMPLNLSFSEISNFSLYHAKILESGQSHCFMSSRLICYGHLLKPDLHLPTVLKMDPRSHELAPKCLLQWLLLRLQPLGDPCTC